jgi:hypothetical protein
MMKLGLSTARATRAVTRKTRRILLMRGNSV